MSTFYVFIALIVFFCFLLILVIMVQNPKGGGLSSSFGGGVQQMGGVQKTTDFLDRSTWILGAGLLILILLSNIALEKGNTTSDSKLIQEENIEEIIPEEVFPNNSIPEVKD
jgi:preprotein translocase subunit SecG